ncbi:hypothetical protein [uncultured Paracoccus sp.]|uniref:hypothetical protein n=1 Tax=uncultured Paracoccus sp. TaxID=189685 RepID=UPI0026294D49|nr:hypothetical protein [uncultured Paracoccus sp.]
MLTINPVDEAIWHFIGLFEITEERGRMWVDYDRFAALKVDVDPGGIEPLDLVTKAPFDLRDLLPQIRYNPPTTQPPELSFEAPYFPPEPIVQDMLAPGQGDTPVLDLQNFYVAGPNIPGAVEPPEPPGPPEPPEVHEPPQWELPPPSSIAGIVVQVNRLDDDDRVDGDRMAHGEVKAEVLAEKLDGMLGHASQMGVTLTVDYPDTEASYLKIAEAFRQSSAPDEPVEGGTATTLHGEQVTGMYVDGAVVTDRPDIDSLMPDYRDEEDSAEDTDAADGTNDAKSASSNVARPEDSGDDDDGPDHELVHGNNTLVNQVTLTEAWITAPVLVAGGNAYNYNIISQTNVWSDADSFLGAAEESTPAEMPGAGDPTLSLNYASYASFSNPIPDRDGSGDAPQYWATATIEGNLVNVAWIDQYNLVSDNDVTAITIMGERTLYLMGENGSFNTVSLAELGTSYDVIVIGGDVINLNAILQTNVLLDDDRIMVSGGNAMVSAGDNLLANEASILQTGETSIRHTTADQDAMLAAAAIGDLVLSQSVLNDPSLRDLEVVRVLHVKGDLVSLNLVRQTNVLGDSDQIEVYMDGIGAGPGQTSILTGSNVLVNSAIISEFGVDSTLYAGGEVYSDALLHQAELISTDAPLMPAGGALASEAVLFLAEGMLTDEMDDIEFRPIGADHATSADAMETVLA